MCGIMAYLGNNNCFSFIFNGLKQLQNRGYDSSGICSISDSRFINIKYASQNTNNALDRLNEHENDFNGMKIGIGHTRWATHGPKNNINAHPHIDFSGKFAIVHNGIIENYNEIKNLLMKNNIEFKSQTDTECIVNMIGYYHQKGLEPVNAIKKTIDCLEGAWAIICICLDEPNTLYIHRKGSPIVISINENFALITSEQSGFNNYVNDYFCLKDNDLCIIKKENDKIKLIRNHNYQLKKINKCDFQSTPYPYKYWTLKEINEQVESSKRVLNMGGRLNNGVKLGGISKYNNQLRKINHIILLGCGTSYHSALYGERFFKESGVFNNVQVFDGSEFEESDLPKSGNIGIIFISQSGETKDLFKCFKFIENKDIFTIGIVNVVDSLIARTVHCGCYLNAGKEVAVASTKSFTNQSILLSMLSVYFMQLKNKYTLKSKKIVKSLHNISEQIEKTISQVKDNCLKYSKEIYEKNSLFVVGKGLGCHVAKEGALKIKEISYIHAEGYSCSSLKHGPFGLLEKDYPVILIIINDETFNKTLNAYNEIKSRHANILVITDKYNKLFEKQIVIPNDDVFSSLLAIIPLQLIAYNISILRGLNPDFPRNLAKVVTVE